MQVKFEYRLMEINEEPFRVPEGNTQILNDIFDKAQNFGTEITMPWDTRIVSRSAYIIEGTVENRKTADEDGLLIISLGFQLRVA